jgi:predicted GNAT family N-acyltransferase
LESDLETVAFFSLLNDKITFEIEANKNKSLWNRINRKVPNSKRSTKGYPAMKIGRLAVNINYKGNNIGTLILDYLKGLFIENNRTGCKFITLDAYKESLDFYSKNEFKFLTIEDELEETRLMYFNLSNLFD